jgi:hypothetical protein
MSTRRVNQPEVDLLGYDDYEEIDLTSIDFTKLSREDILNELGKVDTYLLNINHRLEYISKMRVRIFAGDSDALNLQLRTLKQRSELLLKCLNKVVPDKKSIDNNVNITYSNLEQLPDELLERIAIGDVTDEELEKYGYLFDAPDATQ